MLLIPTPIANALTNPASKEGNGAKRIVNNVTVFTAMGYFKNSIIAGGAKRASAQNRVNFLKRFTTMYGSRNLNSLTIFDIDAYVVSLENLSDATRRSYVKALKQFFSWCEAVGLCANLASRTTPPAVKIDGTIRAVSKEDLALLVEAAGNRRYPYRDKTMVAFLIDSGARPIELVNLRIDHLDLNKGTGYVFGKTHKVDNPRPIDFGEKTADLIRRYLHHERPDVERPQLFINHYAPHKPITYNTVRSLFRRLADDAEVGDNNTAKAIRHYVGQLFTKEENLEIARQKLGHADIKTTQMYANVDRTAVKEATNKLSIVDDLLD